MHECFPNSIELPNYFPNRLLPIIFSVVDELTQYEQRKYVYPEYLYRPIKGSVHLSRQQSFDNELFEVPFFKMGADKLLDRRYQFNQFATNHGQRMSIQSLHDLSTSIDVIYERGCKRVQNINIGGLSIGFSIVRKGPNYWAERYSDFSNGDIYDLTVGFARAFGIEISEQEYDEMMVRTKANQEKMQQLIAEQDADIKPYFQPSIVIPDRFMEEDELLSWQSACSVLPDNATAGGKKFSKILDHSFYGPHLNVGFVDFVKNTTNHVCHLHVPVRFDVDPGTHNNEMVSVWSIASLGFVGAKLEFVRFFHGNEDISYLKRALALSHFCYPSEV